MASKFAYLILLAFVAVYLPQSECICNAGFGARVSGDSLLYSIVVSKGPVDEPANLELKLDYKPNPLYNEQISLASMRSDSTNDCTFTVPQDVKKHVSATVRSNTLIREFIITMDVYGIRYVN
ncbi:uncharacterized protein LOC125948640 [Anopheles darlingi]|uniref:uncharacterized protein LOC125948640 n=1 Tax=Anopheles darlingi TaxID=43151 RepID=UPI002100033D|nr:uncharacterized protein LOC125948640 [Anopheles darlingi]